MRSVPPILSINGSDGTGQSGIGADIQTIAALGGYGVIAVTCIVPPQDSMQKRRGDNESKIFSLPTGVVREQVASIISTAHPRAIKVGLVADSETVRALRDEVIACPRLVVAPGIFDSEGRQMVSDDVISAIARHFVPEAMLLMLRCRDAEKMLGMSISTDDDMLEAARRLHSMGAQWVLLRGGEHTKGRVTALLSQKTLFPALPLYGEGAPTPPVCSFFSSYNTDGWRRHGVAGALSAAVTVRLGMGDDVPTAIRNAHDYIHSQVVYAQERDTRDMRSIDIYNNFVSLVAEHFAAAHDVGFYADRICITPRYLSQVTDRVVGKPPKQIIADYLMSEARSFLTSTRLTVQEIALRLGFSSQVAFSKFFRLQQGASPTDYRGDCTLSRQT